MIELKEIGIIRSPFTKTNEPPRQGTEDTIFEIEIFKEFEEGLKDIEGFSHIHVFYWLHESDQSPLRVITPWDSKPHGVFTTRSPQRPNSIGHSVAELLEKEGRILKVQGLDAIDETPVIDIKPYIVELDSKPDAKMGWFESRHRK